MGGAIHLIAIAGYNCLNVTHNYFTQNYGIMGGVYDLVLLSRANILLTNNLYILNLGYDFNNHIGTGSVVKVTMNGPFLPPIVSKNNTFTTNSGELRGVLAIFSGSYYEEGSVFISIFFTVYYL